MKAFLVNQEVAELFEKMEKVPETFEFLRVMTQEDMMIYEELKKEEVTSFFKCKELVQKHNLVMNLVQCRITFDRRKISFYYTAPERVDFRELLKDLTQVFKRMRIYVTLVCAMNLLLCVEPEFAERHFAVVRISESLNQ